MTDETVLPPGVIRIDTSGRRQYSVEYKRHLAKLTLEPGASVAGIALRHQLNTNQLFKWRRWYVRQERLTGLEPEPAPEATLLPVVVASAGRAPIELPPTRAMATAPVSADATPGPAEPGQIEIALGRTRVRVTGLESGRFVWPRATDGAIALTPAQLAMLLEGIDWRRPVRTAPLRAA